MITVTNAINKRISMGGGKWLLPGESAEVSNKLGNALLKMKLVTTEQDKDDVSETQTAGDYPAESPRE